MRAQLLAASLIATAALACASAHTGAHAGEAPAPSDATVTSFDSTLDALRYLATPEELDSLRNASPEQRPQAWAAFVARYGPRLPEYLARVLEANKRYSERGVPGWETDRGSAYIQLGDPEQVYVEPDIEMWLYTRYFGTLKFHREAERWWLSADSRDMLETLVARAHSAR